MEILSFTVKGKMAHFRKYFANNTAFSFSIPPRTTLMGMIAAFMGWPKESYYENLASEHMRIGIRVLSPLKKSFHRLNYLSIKSTGDLSKKWSTDFRGEGGRIQTPFEVVSAWDITKGEVAYQIFISSTDSGNELFQQLKECFLIQQPVYGITLGTANFTASVSDVQILSAEKKESTDYILLHSAVSSEKIEDLKFDKEEFEQYNFVEEDMMPADFVANGNRELRKMNRLLFSTTPYPMRVIIKGVFYQINIEGEVINIQFME